VIEIVRSKGMNYVISQNGDLFLEQQLGRQKRRTGCVSPPFQTFTKAIHSFVIFDSPIIHLHMLHQVDSLKSTIATRLSAQNIEDIPKTCGQLFRKSNVL
jgi:hypothetical protein